MTDPQSETSIPSAEELTHIVPNASRNTRPRLNWVFVAQFASIEACRDAYPLTIFKIKELTEGVHTESKEYLICRKSSCGFRLCIHFNRRDLGVQVFSIDGQEHGAHVDQTIASRGRVASSTIIQILGDSWNTLSVHDAVVRLHANGIIMTAGAWSTFKSRMNAKAYPRILTLSNMRDWILSHNTEPVGDEDTAFVLKSLVDGRASGEQYVALFITTKRLIGIAKQSKTLHTDATYKMTKNYYPVIVLGVSDAAQTFHPVGIVLTTKENSIGYTFALDSLLSALGGHKFDYLIADNSLSITAAFEREKASLRRIKERKLCWYHVHEAIKHASLSSKIVGLTQRTPQQRAAAKSAIGSKIVFQAEVIHEALTADHAASLTNLMIQKLSNSPHTSQDFKNYFITNWANNAYSWHLHDLGKAETTNAGLESFNKQLKTHGKVRIEMRLGECLTEVCNYLSECSKRRNDLVPYAYKPAIFATEAVLPETEKKAAKTFPITPVRVRLGESVAFLKDGNSFRTITEIPAAPTTSVTAYYHWRRNYSRVSRYSHGYECTCVEYITKRICQHVYLVEYWQNNDELLVENNRPGRPSIPTHSAMERIIFDLPPNLPPTI